MSNEEDAKRQSTNTSGNLRPIDPTTSYNGGRIARPRLKHSPETPAEIRALLYMVLDKDTAEKMVVSLRRKIAKGNIGTLEFIFDRLVGRPAVNVHHDADGALAEFMTAWAELAKTEQTLTIAGESAGMTIDAECMTIEDAELDDNEESAEEDAK